MSVLRGEALSSAFDHAARTYDRLVAANPGYHADLRRTARRLRLGELRGAGHGEAEPGGDSAGRPAAGTGAGLGRPDAGTGAGLRLLDLGCGTGASTAALLAAAPRAEIVAVDASAGMLERAAGKRWPAGVTFVHAAAERLEQAGVRGPFDAVLAAYLFRNLADPDAVLADVRSLLAPRGRLAVHEYTLGGRRVDRLVWAAVCNGVVRPAGTLTGDRRLYRHLYRSVAGFDTADRFAERVRRAGFGRVRVLPMPGWQTGIVHSVLASSDPANPEASPDPSAANARHRSPSGGAPATGPAR